MEAAALRNIASFLDIWFLKYMVMFTFNFKGILNLN